jgi:hypothetical protein
MKPTPKITKFGLFCTVHTERLPSGIYRHTLTRHDMPNRLSGMLKKAVIYRKSATPQPHWVLVKAMEAVAIGQILVSSFRELIDSGEITKAQAKEIKMALRFKYGYGEGEPTPLYTSRQYQNDLCLQAHRVTGHKEFAWHEAMI